MSMTSLTRHRRGFAFLFFVDRVFIKNLEKGPIDKLLRFLRSKIHRKNFILVDKIKQIVYNINAP